MKYILIDQIPHLGEYLRENMNCYRNLQRCGIIKYPDEKLDLLNAFQPDLVIFAVKDMDGKIIETIRRIRRIKGVRGLIVFHYQKISLEWYRLLKEAGADFIFCQFREIRKLIDLMRTISALSGPVSPLSRLKIMRVEAR